MSKPDYFKIAQENQGNGPISDLYVFTEELTEPEKELFEYAKFGYFTDNPGYVEGDYASTVGVYYTEEGDKSA